jgi:cell division protein FtsA
MRRGAIIEVAEAAPAVARVVAEIKKFSKDAATNIYAAIGTTQIKVQTSRGIVAVSRTDSEIYQDDIERVVKASQAIQLAPNRMVIHSITREFIVDGAADIIDPLGLKGNRLESNSLIVDAFAPHVRNVMRSVELGLGEVSGLVFTPLAIARSVISKAQKNLGTVLISIGAGTTGVAIFEENKLWGVAQFPVGGANISGDIAIGLKIPIDVAEKIKREYGFAVARDIHSKDMIDLATIMPDGRGTVSRRLVAEIIQSRLDEIFELVSQEIKLAGKAGQLAGGALLIGGTSMLPGISDLARQELKLTVQLGSIIPQDWIIETTPAQQYLEDPDFAGAAGLVLSGMDLEDKGKTKGFGLPGVSKMKELFKYFMP